MAAWILIACLKVLMAEFTALAPKRDHGSDGSVADLTHVAGGTSDHIPDEDAPALRGKDADAINEVHAIDVDSTGPWPPGWSMDRCVQIIVTRHREGNDNRLQNVIFNGRIWSASWGWTARVYTGKDQHTGHAHFSARYGSGGGPTNPENDTSPWGLLAAATLEGDDDMALDADQTRNAVKLGLWDALGAAAAAAQGQDIAPPGRDAADRYGDQLAGFLRAIVGGPVSQADIVAAVQAGHIDPQQVIAGVVAGLPVGQIVSLLAKALPADLAKQTANELAARLAS